jgi:hypothetical protein
MQDSHALAVLGFSPTALFDGFPYLVTRIVPAMYHVIVLPDDLDPVRLVQIARHQARSNALPTCLVRRADSALYISPDGRESLGTPPRGGVIVTDRLRLHRAFPETESLAARLSALERFVEKHKNPKGGYMFGDLTKGGRAATLEELVLLTGTQSNGVPRGLTRCGQCGEWQGRCLDPSATFARRLMNVHCRCANDNRCARCGEPLHVRKLNANEYNEFDGQIWHTPGFSGLRHACATDRPSQLEGAQSSSMGTSHSYDVKEGP